MPIGVSAWMYVAISGKLKIGEQSRHGLTRETNEGRTGYRNHNKNTKQKHIQKKQKNKKTKKKYGWWKLE